MCKHVLNAKCSIRAACCKKWFDCPQCHAESADHALKQAADMTMGCKNCKAVFRRPPIDEFEDADEYCPRCDAHLVVEAELPEPPRNIMLNLEASGEMFDDRVKQRVTPEQFQELLMKHAAELDAELDAELAL